ncbi:MAG: ABC transporter permease [bacterium]|nr:ABC transporter permease [bacterium]
MDPSKYQLPKAVQRLLGFFCKGDFLEEILGDLEEYHFELEEYPRWQRPFLFWFQAINFIRPYSIREFIDRQRIIYLLLLSNYLKTSIRTLRRNPLSSFINVLGLTIAIGMCVTIYAFLSHDFRIDQFHENKDQIYLTTLELEQNGQLVKYGHSPIILGTTLHDDMGEISKFSRVSKEQTVVKYRDNVHYEEILFVDGAFLEMFSFPLKWGVSRELNDDSSIILSHDMSHKYFGYENPIGQEIEVNMGSEMVKFRIAGVASPFPISHALKFDFLINISNAFKYDLRTSEWGEMIDGTFLQIVDPNDVSTVLLGLKNYITNYNEGVSDNRIESFGLQQFSGLHFASRQLKNELSHDNYYEGRVTLPIAAVLILALACFNYINIAIASAARRLKEIGLRKVIGADKRLIISQFMTEHLVVTAFALILGVLFSLLVILPWFNSLSGIKLAISITDPLFWVCILSVLIVTSLISGVYPSIYIAKFEPDKIFKGTLKFGKNSLITKILLGAQFVIACNAIHTAVVFTQNKEYQNTRSWGYNPNDIVYIRTSSPEEINWITEYAKNSDVITAFTGTQHQLGINKDSVMVQFDTSSIELDVFRLSGQFVDMAEIEIVNGANFSDDSYKQVLVNELLYQRLGELGEFSFSGNSYVVVGVVRDFHNLNFYSAIKPSVILNTPVEDSRYISMKCEEGKSTEFFADLNTSWLEQFPATPFIAGHQEDVWGQFYDQIDIMEEYNDILATITVLIAGMGLYSLIVFNTLARQKEFSIKKIMGAKLSDLAIDVIKRYSMLAIIAMIVGAPMTYFLVKKNLDILFKYAQSVTIGSVILAIVILLSLLLLVIATQVRKISRTNPAEGLKVES